MPPHRSAHPWPLSGSNRRRFFARSGRKMAPPPPRRLCACSSRCIPAAAQRTTWMPWQWRHCAQNLIRSGFGGIEKLRFPPPPGPCEQPGAQSSCRTSSSISWLPKDRQSFTRAVSRAYELLLRVLCTNCAICYELRIRAEYIRNKSTCGGVGCGRGAIVQRK